MAGHRDGSTTTASAGAVGFYIDLPDDAPTLERPTFRRGRVFDTASERGCIAWTEPGPAGDFEAIDSDGVLCSYVLRMVKRVDGYGASRCVVALPDGTPCAKPSALAGAGVCAHHLKHAL